MRKNDKSIESLKSIVPETYVVGDCGGVADIGNAVHSAFNRAVEGLRFYWKDFHKINNENIKEV
jgi:hypothetical protein